MTARVYDSNNYRFWAMDVPDAADVGISDPNTEHFGPGWDAIVDDEAGGIVLYCQESLTNLVLAALRADAKVEY